MGKIYGPYRTGTCFATAAETDIKHIVSLSEAHDSGLCAASATVRAAFTSDTLKLTLISPSANRHQKRAKDVAGVHRAFAIREKPALRRLALIG